MSLNKRIFFAAVFSLTLVCVFLLPELDFSNRSPFQLSHRKPASVQSKSDLFKPSLGSIAKADQMVNVVIEPVDGFATTNQETTRLRATVTLNRNVSSNLSLQWKLPPGAEMVSGVAAETLSSMQVGESLTREILVRGFSSEGNPRNVILEASTVDQGSPVGATGVCSSHPTRKDLSLGFRENQSQEVNRLGKIRAQSDEPIESNPIPKGIHF